MRGWVAPLIGIPLGLVLAVLGAMVFVPSMPGPDLSAVVGMVRVMLGPVPMRPSPPAVPAPAPPPPLPVVVAGPRIPAPPRPAEPSPPPARVEDLLRPPPGATSQASGTGFFVSSRGAVITAAHVVSGCRAIRVLSRHVPASRAEILATDVDNDIALLQAHDVTPPAQLSISAPAPVTTKVFVLGYPATARHDVPAETWATLVNDSFPHSAPLITNPRELLWMQNRDIAQGYSGGPILDPATGRVVGIVRALIDARKAAVAYGIGMENLSIGPGAVPLRAMLAREPIRDGVVPASFGGEGALEVARKATVHVFCWL